MSEKTKLNFSNFKSFPVISVVKIENQDSELKVQKDKTEIKNNNIKNEIQPFENSSISSNLLFLVMMMILKFLNFTKINLIYYSTKNLVNIQEMKRLIY